MGEMERDARRSRWRAAAPPIVICAAVFTAFAPGIQGDLLHWDDDRLAADNPLVGPPYLANTARMFSEIRNEAYQPLHTASYQIDRALWALEPVGCHLFNLALYALGACLAYLLLCRLGAPRLPALVGTLLFALHPTHVESVVWISGRKDVLSLVFVALALLAHVRSMRPLDRWNLVSTGLFLLAGLTKTTSLFLPLLIPFVDRWALGRPWRIGLARAAPMACVAAVLGALVTWIWYAQGLTRTLESAGSRFALAPKVLLHYAASVAWPQGLSPLYPIDRTGAFDGRSAAGIVLLGGLIALAWYARGSARLVSLGIATFLLGLLPVLNIVPMTFQVNDRYLLLPTLGVAFALCGYAELLGPRPRVRAVLLGGAAWVAVALGAVAFAYSFAWRDDLALWRHATGMQPRSYYAWMKLGETYRDHGSFFEADAAYRRAVDLAPDLMPARGGRMLNCLVAADRTGGRSREMPVDLAGRYAQAYGDAMQMLRAAQPMFARGYDGCAFAAMIEATEVDPPLPDGVLIQLAREWIDHGRRAYARELLERITPQGRATPAWNATLRAIGYEP